MEINEKKDNSRIAAAIIAIAIAIVSFLFSDTLAVKIISVIACVCIAVEMLLKTSFPFAGIGFLLLLAALLVSPAFISTLTGGETAKEAKDLYQLHAGLAAREEMLDVFFPDRHSNSPFGEKNMKEVTKRNIESGNRQAKKYQKAYYIIIVTRVLACSIIVCHLLYSMILAFRSKGKRMIDIPKAGKRRKFFLRLMWLWLLVYGIHFVNTELSFLFNIDNDYEYILYKVPEGSTLLLRTLICSILVFVLSIVTTKAILFEIEKRQQQNGSQETTDDASPLEAARAQ